MSFASYSLAACCRFYSFFFFNDTATTEIYTLSLHDALPISGRSCSVADSAAVPLGASAVSNPSDWSKAPTIRRMLRSEEHTSELQSPCNLVCRLLLEKKKIQIGDSIEGLIRISKMELEHIEH